MSLGLACAGIYPHRGVTRSQNASLAPTIARRRLAGAVAMKIAAAPAGDLNYGGVTLTGIDRQAAHRLCWIGAACAVLALAGCKSDSEAVALPSPSNVPTSPQSSVSEDEAVRRVYTSFIAMLDHADSLPESSRKQQLSTLMVEPQLSRVLKRAEELESKNLTSYGKVVVHIASVDVAGNDATLRDCQDSSKAGVMNKDTHKKSNRGVEKGNTKAYLIKSADGKWRVSKYVVLGEGC